MICDQTPIVKRWESKTENLSWTIQKTQIHCVFQGECANPVEDILVAELIVHENYDASSRSQANDIGLIRLQRPAPYTNYIRPICLPILDLQNKNYDGSALIVAGFGRIENGIQSI